MTKSPEERIRSDEKNASTMLAAEAAAAAAHHHLPDQMKTTTTTTTTTTPTTTNSTTTNPNTTNVDNKMEDDEARSKQKQQQQQQHQQQPAEPSTIKQFSEKSLNELADYYLNLEPAEIPDTGYVVSGIAGRFPNADNLNELWDNLLYGKDMVLGPDDKRWPLGKF